MQISFTTYTNLSYYPNISPTSSSQVVEYFRIFFQFTIYYNAPVIIQFRFSTCLSPVTSKLNHHWNLSAVSLCNCNIPLLGDHRPSSYLMLPSDKTDHHTILAGLWFIPCLYFTFRKMRSKRLLNEALGSKIAYFLLHVVRVRFERARCVAQ